MRLLGVAIRTAFAVYLITVVSLLGWTFLWPDPDFETLAGADAVVCLGGGMNAEGQLAQATLTRVDRCVQLYQAGSAPIIAFTGGTARPDGTSAGAEMARYARGLGVPDSAIVIEGQAQSTLQNALFSLEALPPASRLIVVTEAFHLPRAWASFRWAAWELDRPQPAIALVMSEHVRRTATDQINWRILIRESLAIWFNAARALVYSLRSDISVDWLS